MQWDKQTEATMNGWLGMQEKMIKQWWDVLAHPNENGHAAASPNPLWDLWLDQWQSLGRQNFAALSQQVMADVTKNTVAQFLHSQTQAQQLMRLVTEAWTAMLANATSPAEWQSALVTFTDQMRQQIGVISDGAKLMENSTELWRLYSEEAQKFVQPWLTAWWQTPVFMSQLGGSDHAAATNEFMQLFHAAFQQTMGRALMAPSIGLTREFNEKVSKGFDLWLENQQALMTYQLLVGEAWVDAFQALMQKLVAMAQKGETITDQRHLLRIWVEVADEVFIELFHSDAYAAAQSAYVNSNMALRRQQRDLMEVWLRTNDLPTRTDVDEAHHQIYQLRKEVKALKKSVAVREAQAAPVAAPTKAKAGERAAGKKRTTTAGKADTKTAGAETAQASSPSDSDTPDSSQSAQEGVG